MGFRKDAYCTVWSVDPVSDVQTKARISISRKDKQTGEYIEDFSGFVSFFGTAAAKKLSDFIANQKDFDPDVICQYTVEKWLKQWLEDYVVKNVKVSTRVSYEGIVKNQLIPFPQGFEFLQIFSTEHFGNDLNGKEEAFSFVSPLIIRGQASTKKNGMDMGMEVHLRSPCVEDEDIANFCAEMSGVFRQFPDRCGCRMI